MVVNHFMENEDVFNRLADTFLEIADTYEKAELVDGSQYRYCTLEYGVISGGGPYQKNTYILRNYSNENKLTYLFDYEPSNTLSIIELDRIFYNDEDYDIIGDERIFKQNESFKYSQIVYWEKGYLQFHTYYDFNVFNVSTPRLELIYSLNGDRTTMFDSSKIQVKKEYWLNDHWYIIYYFIDPGR